VVAVSLVLLGIGVSSVRTQAAAAPAPTRTISVAGNGVAMYPAFALATTRYGITTTALTAGTVTINASTTDPSGRVWVDGQPEVGGTATLTGLASGDEISVLITDTTGTTAYSLIYLPVGFPALTATTELPGIAPGDVFLTLSDFTGTTASFETVVDNNGVPVYVRTDNAPGVPTDFKLEPNGDYSVFRQPTPTPGRFGGQIVELNSQFKRIAAFETVAPLVFTDGHDAILLPNGDHWLSSTVPDNGGQDDVIQEIGPTGKLLFSWSTADHLNFFDPTLDGLSGTPDYAHLNSFALTANGDIVVSFRHTSQIMQIATSNHDGFTKGQVEWTLGGRRPTLALVNPSNDPFNPDSGPCAQHDASVLANGDILVFDDGSESLAGSPLLCVNPADPSGPAVARPQSRVAEYSVSQKNKTATLVWSYVVPDLDSTFAGSAQRLPDDNTLIGWGGSHGALATEINGSGSLLWELGDAPSNMISYRAFRFPVPDAIRPAVVLTAPAPGATFAFGETVSSDFSCTDRGGSNLQACAGSVAEGARINTSTPGTHTFTVVAKDGAGNTTTVTRTYRVGPAPYQPDAQIKTAGSGAFTGNNVYAYAGVAKQDVTQSIAKTGRSVVALARFQNDGTRTDRITIRGTTGTAKFQVSYFAGSTNVTKRVTAGTYKTPSLATGKTFSLRVRVTRTANAKPGVSRTVRLSATSVHDPVMHDAVSTVVRAIR
jgi:hypothetical protein